MRFVLQKLGVAKEYKTKGAAAQHSDSLFAPHASVRSLSQPYTQGNTATLSQQAAQQDELLRQMWMALGGPYYSHVTLNNLRMLLLAVKGFRVQPDIALNDEGDIGKVWTSDVIVNHIGCSMANGLAVENDVTPLLCLFLVPRLCQAIFIRNGHSQVAGDSNIIS